MLLLRPARLTFLPLAAFDIFTVARRALAVEKKKSLRVENGRYVSHVSFFFCWGDCSVCDVKTTTGTFVIWNVKIVFSVIGPKKRIAVRLTFLERKSVFGVIDPLLGKLIFLTIIRISLN